MSKIVDLCQEIADFLATSEVEPVVQYLLKITPTADIGITIVPNELEMTQLVRGAASAWGRQITIDIGVHCKCKMDEVDTMAPTLLSYIESLADTLAGASWDHGSLLQIKHQPIYDQQMLKEQGVLISLVQVVFSG